MYAVPAVTFEAPQPSRLGADGVPDYPTFRFYAAFVPEVGDFGLDERQLRRLLAQCGLGLVGGMGLGDVGILFSSQARRGHVSYDAVCSICRWGWTLRDAAGSWMRCQRGGRRVPVVLCAVNVVHDTRVVATS